MFKQVFLWTVGLIILNLIFVACSSVAQPQIQPTPSEELLDNKEFITVSFQNNYDGRCVENANDFVLDFCDNDSDGLLNYQEARYKTNLFASDTDNDGYYDNEEIERAYNPLEFGDLVPEKYKYCERASQVWCWKAQAYYKADPKVCDNLLCDGDDCQNTLYANRNRSYEDCKTQAQKARDLINLELAVAEWDYEACNIIIDQNIKEDCQKQVAFILGALNQSKDFCMETFGFSKIKKDEVITVAKEMQHRCWFAMAVATEDVEMCSYLDSHVIKDFDSIACVTKIARLKNDKEICNYLNEIGLSAAVSRCLGESALPSEDK